MVGGVKRDNRCGHRELLREPSDAAGSGRKKPLELLGAVRKPQTVVIGCGMRRRGT